LQAVPLSATVKRIRNVHMNELTLGSLLYRKFIYYHLIISDCRKLEFSTLGDGL